MLFTTNHHHHTQQERRPRWETSLSARLNRPNTVVYTIPIHSTHECNQYKIRATKQFNRQPILTKKKCIYHKNASNHTTEECNFLNRKAITKKTNGIVEFEVAINQRYLHGTSDPLKIYLDTSAQISIFNNFELLSNIREVAPIKIYGVNRASAPIIANQAGYLKGFSNYSFILQKINWCILSIEPLIIPNRYYNKL